MMTIQERYDKLEELEKKYPELRWARQITSKVNFKITNTWTKEGEPEQAFIELERELRARRRGDG